MSRSLGNFSSFSRIFSPAFFTGRRFIFHLTAPDCLSLLHPLPAAPPAAVLAVYTRLHSSLLWRADKRAEKVLNLMATPKNAVTATERGS